MQIILAIDIKNGLAVKAFAGFRLNYKPLRINNEDFSNPFKLIKHTKKQINIEKIYIADLNSIEKKGSNVKLINKLMIQFPNLIFLIDAGFSYPISINNYHMEKKKKKLHNYQLVLGTETLKNFNLECFVNLKKIQFSLDFNGKQKKWLRKFYKEKKTLDITLMFINKTGGRGLNFKLIRRLNSKLLQHRISVAGGLSNFAEIRQLSQIGVKSVLSSTLIHRRISRDRFFSP